MDAAKFHVTYAIMFSCQGIKTLLLLVTQLTNAWLCQVRKNETATL